MLPSNMRARRTSCMQPRPSSMPTRCTNSMRLRPSSTRARCTIRSLDRLTRSIHISRDLSSLSPCPHSHNSHITHKSLSLPTRHILLRPPIRRILLSRRLCKHNVTSSMLVGGNTWTSLHDNRRKNRR